MLIIMLAYHNLFCCKLFELQARASRSILRSISSLILPNKTLSLRAVTSFDRPNYFKRPSLKLDRPPVDSRPPFSTIAAHMPHSHPETCRRDRPMPSSTNGFSIISWNVLAQCYVDTGRAAYEYAGSHIHTLR
jgi:hypothetical protein